MTLHHWKNYFLWAVHFYRFVKVRWSQIQRMGVRASQWLKCSSKIPFFIPGQWLPSLLLCFCSRTLRTVSQILADKQNFSCPNCLHHVFYWSTWRAGFTEYWFHLPVYFCRCFLASDYYICSDKSLEQLIWSIGYMFQCVPKLENPLKKTNNKYMLYTFNATMKSCVCAWFKFSPVTQWSG